MVDINDIWDDEEDMAMYRRPAAPAPAATPSAEVEG